MDCAFLWLALALRSCDGTGASRPREAAVKTETVAVADTWTERPTGNPQAFQSSAELVRSAAAGRRTRKERGGRTPGRQVPGSNDHTVVARPRSSANLAAARESSVATVSLDHAARIIVEKCENCGQRVGRQQSALVEERTSVITSSSVNAEARDGWLGWLAGLGGLAGLVGWASRNPRQTLMAVAILSAVGYAAYKSVVSCITRWRQQNEWFDNCYSTICPCIAGERQKSFDPFEGVVVVHSIQFAKNTSDNITIKIVPSKPGGGLGEPLQEDVQLAVKRAQRLGGVAVAEVRGREDIENATVKFSIDVRPPLREVRICFFTQGILTDSYLGSIILDAEHDISEGSIASKEGWQEEVISEESRMAKIVNAKNTSVGKAQVSVYVNEPENLKRVGFKKADLYGGGNRLTMVRALEWSHARLRLSNHLNAPKPPRTVNQANVWAALLTGNFCKHKSESDAYDLVFFEIVWKRSAERYYWVWYKSKSLSGLPGSVSKGDVLGFIPVGYLAGVQEVDRNQLMVSYNGPKGERGQLLIGPDPTEPGRFRDTQDIHDALTKFVQLTAAMDKEKKEGGEKRTSDQSEDEDP